MADDMADDGDSLGAFFGEIMKVLSGAGSASNSGVEVARSIANRGETEPNIDPSQRFKIEELMRVAELQVDANIPHLVRSDGPIKVEVVNRTLWIDDMVKQYRSLLSVIASKIAASFVSGVLPIDESDNNHPMNQMIAGLSSMLESLMLPMTAGSMVGELAKVAFSGFHLPIPRPSNAPLLVLLPNLDSFAKQWSLDKNDLRLWVCLNETIHHRVLSIPHVAKRLNKLLQSYANAFAYDPEKITDEIGEVDLNAGPEVLLKINSSLSDPEMIFGAVRSPEQELLEPEITALTAALRGYIDHVMDQTGGKIIGSYQMLKEAMQRQRVQADASDRYVERILGIKLDQGQYERGSDFVNGVLDRAGSEGLNRLFDNPENLPTPSEVDAPGLWLARIDIIDIMD